LIRIKRVLVTFVILLFVAFTFTGVNGSCSYAQDLENKVAPYQNSWYYPYLSELFAKGLLDDRDAANPEGQVGEQELVELLTNIMLLTEGRSIDVSLQQEGEVLSRRRFIGLLDEFAEAAGLEPQVFLFDDLYEDIHEDPEIVSKLRNIFNVGLITGYPDGSLQLDRVVSRAEMWAASVRFLRLIEKGNIMPEGFVYLDEVIPDAIYDIRYYTNDNFVGRRVDGYIAPRVILTHEAAEALARVAEECRQNGLLLKIFDGYRPQQAVNNFVRWAADIDDQIMKSKYYPDVDKRDLFHLNFIAEKSGHSRGSTVDLTLVDALTGEELDMASGFDFFGEISHHDSPLITPQQLQNRNLLRDIMVRHGFAPYPEEWWHYTLVDEPYPDTYFDFPVRYLPNNK
jgi:D-alanyl-D-alanine dipeptidase